MMELLMDALARFEPGLRVHLGSRSSFVAIDTAEAMLEPGYMDRLTRHWQRLFARWSARAAMMYDICNRNCTDPVKLEKARLWAEQTAKRVADFRPFDERHVLEVYERFHRDGIIVVIEGDELGEYWFYEQIERRRD